MHEDLSQNECQSHYLYIDKNRHAVCSDYLGIIKKDEIFSLYFTVHLRICWYSLVHVPQRSVSMTISLV